MIVKINSIKYKIKNKYDHIESILLQGQQWNSSCIKIIKFYADKFNLSHFVNVGCHIGTVCLPLSLIFEKVTAIEAYKPTYNHLLENIALNDIHNLQAINLALSDKKETIYFLDQTSDRLKNNSGGMHVITKNDIIKHRRSSELVNRNSGIQGKANKLDNLKTDNFDIMLVDIEGMEYKMLEGAQDKILKNKPIIIIEIWNDMKRKKENMKTSRRDIMNNIIDLGYTMHHRFNNDFIFLPDDMSLNSCTDRS